MDRTSIVLTTHAESDAGLQHTTQRRPCGRTQPTHGAQPPVSAMHADRRRKATPSRYELSAFAIKRGRGHLRGLCRSASPVLAARGPGALQGGRACAGGSHSPLPRGAPYMQAMRPRTALPSQFYGARRDLLAEQETALQRLGSPQCQALSRRFER